jgi:hypothetical protein
MHVLFVTTLSMLLGISMHCYKVVPATLELLLEFTTLILWPIELDEIQQISLWFINCFGVTTDWLFYCF